MKQRLLTSSQSEYILGIGRERSTGRPINIPQFMFRNNKLALVATVKTRRITDIGMPQECERLGGNFMVDRGVSFLLDFRTMVGSLHLSRAISYVLKI